MQDEWAALPDVDRGRAILAVSLAQHLLRAGWFLHQEPAPIMKHEDQSTPASFISPPAAVVGARLQSLFDTVVAGTRMPIISVPVAGSRDESNRVIFEWSSDERPAERSYTRTTPPTSSGLWSKVVLEVAAGWASFRHGLSYGLLFLGPKERLIHWPRLLNTLLAHIPVAYGSVFDLFLQLALLGLKTDLKSGYRAITISPHDAQYVAAALDGVCVVFERLSFGLMISAAVFVRTLAKTIATFRSSMRDAAGVMSTFVDDTAAGAMSDVQLLTIGEKLLHAFLSDGWWLSIPKTFCWPAEVLFYLGILADFRRQSVQISTTAAEKLRLRLFRIPRPFPHLLLTEAAAALDATAHVRDLATLRTALQRPGTSCISFPWLALASILPLLRAPFRVVAPAGSALTPSIPYTAFHSTAELASLLLFSPVILLEPSGSILRRISDLPLHRGTLVVIEDAPPRTDREPFAPSEHILPACVNPPLKRPLSAIPLDPVPQPSAASTALSGLDVHNLQKALGPLSHFQTVLPYVGVWRRHIDAVVASSTWTVDGVAALDYLTARCSSLAAWPRGVRVTPPVLHVVVDSATAGWGAVIFLEGRLFRFAGSLPPYCHLLSSTARELCGAVCAILAAFRMGLPIAAVSVTMDSSSGVGAARGHAHAVSLLPPLCVIADWEAQGLRLDFGWQSRQDGFLPTADILSRSSPRWTLTHPAASWLWGRSGGWDSDVASNQTSSTAPSYATDDIPDAEIASALDGLCGSQGIGWMGTTDSFPTIAHAVYFAFPRWSTLGLIRHRLTTTPFPLILVAPTTPDDWWGPALAALQKLASSAAQMPRNSSTPPVDLRNPATLRDPRPLTAYFFNMHLITPTHRARPHWFTPYSLTADGDIEHNPGPPKTDRGSYDDLFSCRSPRPPIRPTPLAPHAPSIPAHVQTARDPLHPVETAAPAPAPPQRTIGDWLRAVAAFHAGTAEVLIPADVPIALHSDVRRAAGMRRVKAAAGSSRPGRIPRYFLTLARAKGVEGAPFSLAVVDALATSYVVQRLHRPPPFGWRNTEAPALSSDVSALAEASRRAGYPSIPSHCGPNTAAYLLAEGSNDTATHSAAYGFHLSTLVAIRPLHQPGLHIWDCLLVMSLFCLRTGVLFHLTPKMFVPWIGGYILTWRFAFKNPNASASDPHCRSRTVHFGAARHPALHRILTTTSPNATLFGDLSYVTLSSFVRAHISGAPDGFDVRAYGNRTFADAEATALNVPPAIIDALFWWKREGSKAMRSYYNTVNLYFAMVFSEARMYVSFAHAGPGHGAASLSRPPPDWLTCHVLDAPLPAFDTALLNGAWHAEAPTLVAARAARTSRPPPPTLTHTASPFTEQSSSDDTASVASSAASVDCSRCNNHITRYRVGKLCDGSRTCKYILCITCCRDRKSILLCPEHQLTPKK